MQFCCNFLRAADPFLLGFLLPGAQNQPNLAKNDIRKSLNAVDTKGQSPDNENICIKEFLVDFIDFFMLLLLLILMTMNVTLGPVPDSPTDGRIDHSLSVINNTLVACGGEWTKTSCISWKKGQDGWEEFHTLRWDY